MEKWLEFRVEEDCPHELDVYNGCPLCREEAKDAEIVELVEMLEDMVSDADRYYIDAKKLLKKYRKYKKEW